MLDVHVCGECVIQIDVLIRSQLTGNEFWKALLFNLVCLNKINATKNLDKRGRKNLVESCKYLTNRSLYKVKGLLFFTHGFTVFASKSHWKLNVNRTMLCKERVWTWEILPCFYLPWNRDFPGLFWAAS